MNVPMLGSMALLLAAPTPRMREAHVRGLRAARRVEVRRKPRQVQHAVDAGLCQRLTGECLHGQRHVLQALFASLRGDDDFFDPARARSRTGCPAAASSCARGLTGGKDRRDGDR